MPITITVDNPTAAEIQALANAAAGLGGTGGTVTPPQPSIPPDVNVYPLTMPTGIEVGGDVDVGVGPDLISIDVHNSDYTAATPIATQSFAVLIDDKVVAAPMMVTSQQKTQHFRIHGSWGPRPHRVTITTGGLGTGLRDLTISSVQYNYFQLVYNGGPTDSRGAKYAPNSTLVWDNSGVPVTYADPIAVVVPPLVPPVPTAAADVIYNGKTLDQLVQATASGATLTLPAGTFHGAAKVPVPMTIVGAGIGQTTITGQGFTLDNQKGLFDAVASLTLNKFTLSAASVPDGNGAGVRVEPGMSLTLDTMEVTACQDGILTGGAGGVVAISNCNFHNNGAGDGLTHEMYIGSATTSATITNTMVTCGLKSTHAVKSRALATTISGCIITGSSDTTGNVAGSVVDLPEGGAVVISDTTIALAAGAGNDIFLGYAEENAKAGLKTVTLTNVKLIDGTGTGGLIIAKGGTLAIGAGCTYSGTKPPQITGWTSVTGQFTAG